MPAGTLPRHYYKKPLCGAGLCPSATPCQGTHLLRTGEKEKIFTHQRRLRRRRSRFRRGFLRSQRGQAWA
jgi:hypothetical protein